MAREFALLDGQVLGVGSGHGLIARWLAELNPAVSVVGIDVDAARVAVAEATQARSPRVKIVVRDVRAVGHATADPLGASDPPGAGDPPGASGDPLHDPFDAAAAVDLIHHIEPPDRPRVAAAIADMVRPGGLLLIKDVARSPRWKHVVNQLHDRLVSGEVTQAPEPRELAALFEAAGFRVERLYRPSRLSPYPHVILRARRMGA